MKGTLSLRGFRKLRTGAIVATGVFLIGLASIQTTVQASEEDGIWVARTVEQVKADIQKEDNFFKYEIKWGDTLSVISEATNIPVDVLKEMNRVSDRNLFLPHNELLYTEGESVTDSKTKHKIVIKESYGEKEVRTYEVLLQNNHETAEVSFELKETTEKVQTNYTSVVSYGEVYNLVTNQVEGTTETPTLTQPAEEQPTAPGVTETPTPAQPAEEKPATSGTTENPAPAQPAETTPAGSGETENPAPAQPAEEHPAAPGTTEMLAPTKPAEEHPAAPGATETPTPAQPAETTPASSGATETPTPAQPTEEKPATSGTTENPAPTKPVEEHPAAPGVTETPAPTKPAEEHPAAPGATETPAPAQPAEEKPATSSTTENPAPAQPAETTPAGSGATETSAPAKPTEDTPAEEQPAGSGTTETPAPTKPAEEHPVAPGATETLTPAQPAEEKPATSGTTENSAPTQPAETTPAGSGVTETPAPTKPTEDTPADSNNQNNPTEPKDDVEKGLEENESELESRKKMKLEEIDSSSLSPSGKEEAKSKVAEYTKKATEAMKQAKTTEDQATVVDQYEADLTTINTPGVDQGKPDYTNSGLSGNGPEGTHIGDNNAIGHGNSTPENTGFRNAPVYQPRVTRRARSADEPMDKVAIYYNYTEMKDIAGFLGDPGESVVTVPKGATHEQVQAIVKSKIDEKKAELTKKGYTFLEDYFVDKPQEDTIRYDYIVNFTKPSSLRMAPMIQPRASRTRRSVEEPKVKTHTITLYYQLAELEIAGSLGNPGQNYVITVPETATAEEIQQAIDQQTSREKASLSRYFQYVGETNLQNDILDRGFGNFDYVITFARRK